MKQVILIALVALLLAGVGTVLWTVAGLPPVRMVWRYGISYDPGPTGRTLTVNGIEFVEIGPGCFVMGSELNAKDGDRLGTWSSRFGLPWGDQPTPSDEMPVHWVEFPRGFWIARTELTNAQYEAYAPDHPRNHSSAEDNHAVVNVSWGDAKNYCTRLSRESGLEIRLPSEAEWECACRAGSDREICFGDDEMQLQACAWYAVNSDGRAHEVGTRRANPWGLCDFHGNVSEWCEDTYHNNYGDAPTNGSAWTRGGEVWQGTPNRIIRGGCFLYKAGFCRSADRNMYGPGDRSSTLGFRPVFSPPDP